MTEKTQLAIVVSYDSDIALGVIRSLGMAGYTVDFIASADEKGGSEIASNSRYVRKSIEFVNNRADETVKKIVKELLKYKSEEKAVLIPTDKYAMLVVEEYKNELEKYFHMPYVKDGSIKNYMDNALQKELAKAGGFKTPDSWCMQLEEGFDVPEDIHYPCLCKFSSYNGKDVAAIKRCSSKENLKKHIEKSMKNAYGDTAVVEEFLDVDKEYRVSGVCFDEEIVFAGAIEKINGSKYGKGATLAGKIISLDTIEAHKEKICSVLRQFHYVGMFNMKLNVVGDEVYFDDISFGFSSFNFVYFMNGFNIPAVFASRMLGKEYGIDEENKKEGKTFLYERRLWEDYLNKQITKREFENRISAADISIIKCKDDTKPGVIFERQMKAALKNKKMEEFKKYVKRTLMPLINVGRNVKHFIMGYPQTKKSNAGNPFGEAPRVLISGRNYCSNLCMSRSVGKAGYEVEVLRIFHRRPKLINLPAQLRPEAYSKFVKAFHICVYGGNSKNVLRKLIQIADPYRKMLLIPTDDLVANIADMYYDELSKYYLLPSVNHTQGKIGEMMGKNIQKKLAKEAGLLVAECVTIRTEKGNFEIPEEVKYPCFIKPNISKDGSKSKMQKCDNKEELESAIIALSEKKDVEILVEEYLDINREYAVLGLSTKDGAIAPGLFGTDDGGHDGQRGTTMTGTVVSRDDEKALMDNIEKFVASLNYEGLFDVDLIQTKDGRMYFVELNLRYGGSGYAITESGVNLPGMFADYMLKGKPMDRNCRVEQPGKKFLNEKVMFGEYMNSYLAKADVKKYMADADIHFIYDRNDIKPYNHFKKIFYVADLGKLIKKIK